MILSFLGVDRHEWTCVSSVWVLPLYNKPSKTSWVTGGKDFHCRLFLCCFEKQNPTSCWSHPWLCPISALQVNTFISFVFPMVVISVLNTIIANQLLVMFKQAAQENQVCTIGGQQTMLSMSMEPSRVQALKHGVRVLREYRLPYSGTAWRCLNKQNLESNRWELENTFTQNALCSSSVQS